MDRTAALHAWLTRHLAPGFTLSAPIGDASSRRYFRIIRTDGPSLMAMDAPPASNDCQPFLTVAALLKPALRVPAVLAQDLEQGFLLLDDLGETDMHSALLQADGAGIQTLYLSAIDSLLALQSASQPDVLPDYTADTMADDLERFAHWYAGIHLGKPLQGSELAVWERSRALLIGRAQAQGKVWIHFDYHSRNLIAGEPMGVLDFQDARTGPISYDLASLLKDMYLPLPEDFRLDIAIRYWQKARAASLPVPASFDDFYADFEWMGVFRQLRTLGTFARLAHRDGKTRYIDDMPQALAYLRETCVRYAQLHPLFKLLETLTGITTQVGYTF
ncbi:aminoglycoside phosphotransferase family protein [Chitinimonas sp.]|uniref:aminoglycoside phosphotransferase family protein n=1 Tax=Chitinimonas sp. TaxID=1934313 RepID=UPI0035B37B59